METFPSAKAREQFAELCDRVAYGKERFAISKHGKQLAAIISIEDLQLLEYLEDQIDLAGAKKALKASRKEGTIALDDLAKELGLDPDQLRRRKK